VKQPVKLGLHGDDSIEVLSGLKADEAVILSALGNIKAGMHVRANMIKTQ
jgi:multidrug efflux pump subunit AcrA (membrane-fusion protein)